MSILSIGEPVCLVLCLTEIPIASAYISLPSLSALGGYGDSLLLTGLLDSVARLVDVPSFGRVFIAVV